MTRSLRSLSLPLTLGFALVALAACGEDDDTPSVDAGVDLGADAGGPDLSTSCASAAECDDGVFCNGAERCAPGTAGGDARGCVTASETVCMPTQTCDEAADTCITECAVARDADGDGAEAITCGGDDCDDANPARYPGATEVCDAGDVDEDCDGTTFGARDGDGDGAFDAACCNGTTCGTDCDDTLFSVRPDALEDCDGVDNDCDGTIDDGVLVAGFADADGDGYGDSARAAMACPGTAGFATVGGDCSESDRSVNPGATEACDGRDNDCDGDVDDGVLVTGFADLDADGFGNSSSPLTVCPGAARFATVGDDCDDGDRTVNPGQVEICDNVDNDCDGMVDDRARAVTWYRDADGDGYGSLASGTTVSCTTVSGYSLLATDCNDAAVNVSPVTLERCNGRDDDCNGVADFAIAGGNTEDDDGDGFADMRCPVANADCVDTNASIYPMAPELCDALDNDCNGVADTMTTEQLWYRDADGDGFGSDLVLPISTCEPQAGRVTRAGDCNDANRDLRPGANDGCGGTSGVDDDCDGAIDEETADTVWYADSDLDSWGAGTPVLSCSAPSGPAPRYVERPGDCNDTDSARTPDITEDCANGTDDDCDGLADCGDGDCRSVDGCAIDFRIVAVSGSMQAATITRALPVNVVLRVENIATDAATSGRVLTLNPGPGVGVTSPSLTTNAMGQITLTVRAPLRAGPFTVEVRGTATAPLTLNFTATEPEPGTALPVVNAAGTSTTTVATTGGAATLLRAGDVRALARTADGTVYLGVCGSSTAVGVWALSLDGALTPFAGSGSMLGDGGAAARANLPCATGLAVDGPNNTLYVVDGVNRRIRAIHLTTGTIATLAGGGSVGAPSFGDGGPATSALLNSPVHVVLASAGRVVIDDSSIGLRVIDTSTGTIDTLVRQTTCVATRADPSTMCLQNRVNTTVGIPLAVDDAGRVFAYANFGSSRLGASHVVAPAIARLDGDGSFSHIFGQSGGSVSAGAVATAAGSSAVVNLAFDPAGNLYFTDSALDRLFRIEAQTYAVETIAGTGTAASTGDYGPVAMAALDDPSAILFLPSGHALVGERGVREGVRMLRDAAQATPGMAAFAVTSGGTQTVRIGEASAPLVAQLTDGAATGLVGRRVELAHAASAPGAAFLSTRFATTGSSGSISATLRPGTVAGLYTVTASFSDLHGVPVTGSPASFEITATEPASGAIVPMLNAPRFTTATALPSGVAAIAAAIGDTPADMVAASDGTLYLGHLNGFVYAVDPRGTLRLVAGGGTTTPSAGVDARTVTNRATGLSLDEVAGRLYVCRGATGAPRTYFVDLTTGTVGFTPAQAALETAVGVGGHIYDLTVAADGSVYAFVYTAISPAGQQYVRVDAAGTTVTVLASSASACTGALTLRATSATYDKVALDSAGNQWFTGSACGGSVGTTPRRGLVRRTAAGVFDLAIVETVSNTPTIGLDAADNLYFTTTDGRLRRRAASDGTLTTLAGTLGMTTMSTGDYGPASAALLRTPLGATLLPGGRVVVAEDLGTTYVLRAIW